MTRWPNKSGVAVWGPVWSIGAKQESDDFGVHLAFVVNAPGLFMPGEQRRVRLWVRWYNWTFIPEPRQILRCCGSIGWTEDQIFHGDKARRIAITLRCAGENVELIPDDIPQIGRAVNEKWRALVEATTTQKGSQPGSHEDD